MFSNPRLYFFISNIISTSKDNEPYFDKQPIIFMSSFSPNSCLDDKVSDGLSLKGILGVDKIISLEFSINHTFAAENMAIYNSDFFRLQHIHIELKKYKKKLKDPEQHNESAVGVFSPPAKKRRLNRKLKDSEKHDASIYKPQSIPLPKQGYHKHDYFLSVSPFLRSSDLVELKKHCQHILIYSKAPFGKKISLQDLKKSVEGFKKFMELCEFDDPSNFAYQFVIELNDAYPLNTWSSIKTISSIMFQFVFNDTSPLIDLIKVNEKHFI